MNQPGGNLPTFYTREHADYKGTKVALWANKAGSSTDRATFEYSGTIGKLPVLLWRSKGPRGVFFNVKVKKETGLIQVGTANAYVNKGNTLSISLRFNSELEAKQAKSEHELNEPTKAWKNIVFINIFAQVSLKAMAENKAFFAEMGFNPSLMPAPKESTTHAYN